MSALRRQCPSNKTSGLAKRKNGTICQSGNKLALTEAELRLPVCQGLGMHDRPNSESARAQYRRLAQRCLRMVPTIQDQEGRTALLDMARVWLRMAESYKDRKSILLPATRETRPPLTRAAGAAQNETGTSR